MRLPTSEDINRFDSPDERAAAEHFLGKNLDEARGLFEENSMYYQEDLMWMGPRAFRFYVQAAVDYLQGEQGRNDCDMLNCFAEVLEFWLESEPEELRPVAGLLGEACSDVMRSVNWAEFDRGIYGDVLCRYEAAHRHLSSLG